MTVKMGDLLEAQFAGRQSISLEVAKLNLELLLYLIKCVARSSRGWVTMLTARPQSQVLCLVLRRPFRIVHIANCILYSIKAFDLPGHAHAQFVKQPSVFAPEIRHRRGRNAATRRLALPVAVGMLPVMKIRFGILNIANGRPLSTSL